MARRKCHQEDTRTVENIEVCDREARQEANNFTAPSLRMAPGVDGDNPEPVCEGDIWANAVPDHLGQGDEEASCSVRRESFVHELEEPDGHLRKDTTRAFGLVSDRGQTRRSLELTRASSKSRRCAEWSKIRGGSPCCLKT